VCAYTAIQTLLVHVVHGARPPERRSYKINASLRRYMGDAPSCRVSCNHYQVITLPAKLGIVREYDK